MMNINEDETNEHENGAQIKIWFPEWGLSAQWQRPERSRRISWALKPHAPSYTVLMFSSFSTIFLRHLEATERLKEYLIMSKISGKWWKWNCLHIDLSAQGTRLERSSQVERSEHRAWALKQVSGFYVLSTFPEEENSCGWRKILWGNVWENKSGYYYWYTNTHTLERNITMTSYQNKIV